LKKTEDKYVVEIKRRKWKWDKYMIMMGMGQKKYIHRTVILKGSEAVAC
jgi:hypothetical protein